MKRVVIAGVAGLALALAATPAVFAANSAAAPETPAKSQADKTSVRQQLLAGLQQSGFTDVKVMADSFIVQAKDKNGNPVTMFMNPDSFTEVTDVSMNGPSGQGGQSAQSATNQTFATLPSKEDLSSKVVGLDVYNNANQDIGKIKDVAFDNNGVKAYIVGVGGFLGLGDHDVAVRPSAISLTYDASQKKWHAAMNTTADQLKAAPEFKYSSNS